MAILLKSTAYTRTFKLISSSDHLSLKTGAAPVVKISKAGAAFATCTNSPATETANGYYSIALTTTELNTAGDLDWYITATGADDTDFIDQVWDPAVAMIGVNVVNWNGTVVATPATAGIPDINVKNIVNTAAAVDANNLLKVDVEDWKAGVVPAVTVTGVPKVDLQDILGIVVSTPATAGILDVNVKNINNVSTSAVTTVKAVQGLTTADTIATYTGNTPQTGDAFLRLGAPAGASVSADIAEIEGETDLIVTATNTGVAPGAAGGLFIAGTNAATSITTGLTAHIIGTVDTLTTYTGNTPQTGDAYLLLNGTNTELSAAPASTVNLVTMIKWLFLLARNKITQSATTQIVKANDGTTTVGTSTVSDDGTTATRGVFS